MLKYNTFIILAILCAKTINADIFNLANVPLKAASAVESLLETISSTGTNSTGTEDSDEECCGGALDISPEEVAENKCTGGVLDLIQCVVGKKIDTFRRELSKVAFPNKPPQESQPTIDSRIEGSLGDWIRKYIKHSTMQKENNTIFEENGPEEEAENKCTGGDLDLIQCVVGKKIDTFRRELSKVAFPNQPPQESQPPLDSKIEGSLGDWIRKYIKHSTMQNKNNTVFEDNGMEPFVRESDSHLDDFIIAAAGPEEEAENKCTGGVLDFIQCVVGKKINTFRRELSKVAFPNKPPQESQPTIDSKIEGSLGDWIRKCIKHSTMQKENCTSDTIMDLNEFEEEYD